MIGEVDVRVRWERDVTITVTADGSLVLFSERAGLSYRYPPFVTVMWIALQRHGGQLTLAANELASHWQVGPVRIVAVFEMWLEELRDAGLVSYD